VPGRAVIFRRCHPLDAFFATFAGRSLLVHRGLDPEWLRRLLEQGGGGAHFRLHVERQDGRHRPTPVETFVHRHLLPAGLPLPQLVWVGEDGCRVRHLLRRGHLFAAEELPQVFAELSGEDDLPPRYHLALERQGRTVLVRPGPLHPDDNELLPPADWLTPP